MTARLVALLLLGLAGPLQAHESRPGFLSLTEFGEHGYRVLLKVPMRGDKRLHLEPQLPADCQVTTPVTHVEDGTASTRRWRVQCDAGLAGREIAIDGLQATLTDVLVRVEFRDGVSATERLTPSTNRVRLAETPGALSVMQSYTALGIEHILLGIDHLLFVLALLLIVDGRWRLVKTISAFTVAHSLTLAAATLGYVKVPQAPVEAVIALSIVFLALEIARGRLDSWRPPGLAERAPWLVAFVFGLLHGFGFAGALSETGLPENAIPLALLFFNVGVELGQLLFIATVLALGQVLRHLVDPARLAWLRLGPAYAIGGVSSYWLIERVSGF